MNAILDIQNVAVEFAEKSGIFGKSRAPKMRAVDNVSLQVAAGETVGLVGESGCGKTTLARAIMRLVDCAQGAVLLDGRDIARMPHADLRKARGVAQIIFQDPYASLNPRMTVYDTLAEPLKQHRQLKGPDLSGQVSRLMDSVGLAPRLVRKYPHEFSGGQRQRIAIARCLAVQPKLIIADEPVSALDVSIQAQILNLLSDLSKSMNLSMLFISHDLSVVRYLCRRILVMHKGKIVEEGLPEDIFERPQNDYTKALIDAIPVPEVKTAL
jgi:ABC-type oligopeptide transport system ATPase subunit